MINNDFQDADNHIPPSEPPPLLSPSDIAHLIQHGYLAVNPPPHLATLYGELGQTASRLFDLDVDIKHSLYPASQGTELGFYNIEGEKQYLTIRHKNQSQLPHPNEPQISAEIADHNGQISSPPPPPEHNEEATNLSQQLDAISAIIYTQTSAYLHRILCEISRALDIPWLAWFPLLATSKNGILEMPTSADRTSPTLLRMFRYEPEQGVAAPHTDTGLLTLCVGRGKGLQVWKRNNHDNENSMEPTEIVPDSVEAKDSVSTDATPLTAPTAPNNPPSPTTPISSTNWHDAHPFTILTGSSLRILSSLRVIGGKHRVIANPLGRESMVFALRPYLDCSLDLHGFGGQGEVEMKWFWKRLQECRVNVNVGKGEQERRREVMRKKREEGIMGQGDVMKEDEVRKVDGAWKEDEARIWGAG